MDVSESEEMRYGSAYHLFNEVLLYEVAKVVPSPLSVNKWRGN